MESKKERNAETHRFAFSVPFSYCVILTLLGKVIGILQWELLPSLAAEGAGNVEHGLEDGVNAATFAGRAV